MKRNGTRGRGRVKGGPGITGEGGKEQQKEEREAVLWFRRQIIGHVSFFLSTASSCSLFPLILVFIVGKNHYSLPFLFVALILFPPQCVSLFDCGENFQSILFLFYTFFPLSFLPFLFFSFYFITGENSTPHFLFLYYSEAIVFSYQGKQLSSFSSYLVFTYLFDYLFIYILL